MSSYEVISAIILLAAVFAYINFRFIKCPGTIGIMALSLIFSVVIAFSGSFFPLFSSYVVSAVSSVNFQKVLMEIMLSFLLFAGAMHINLTELKKVRLSVITMASVGILISTALIGLFTFLLFRFFDFDIPLIYCLVFGALISPTDPVAVLGILKESKISKSLELKISGESLFNDGVAVVLFIGLSEIAVRGIETVSVSDVALLFLQEAGGGIAFGLMLGYIGFWSLRSIDNYNIEVLITVALVMAGYTLANHIHISGPLAIVVAGILTGNKAKKLAMSDLTRDYLTKFWELIDEILNAILFLLIGLEMLVIKTSNTLLSLSLLVILLVLISRWISVSLPTLFLRRYITLEKHTLTILTWGGLRGGISVALALSLPEALFRNEFVQITYVVVVFSILVQGLTIGKLAARLAGAQSQR
ncbi:cation:proton antiporter [Arcticibacter sp. MXS-1]|uniref:cation:proton antiporter n=1 Tax=Arcticibacter sp. MXS-1 TaxID=3341726 RepID=UPI0035A8269C